jgi:hypothetical protein
MGKSCRPRHRALETPRLFAFPARLRQANARAPIDSRARSGRMAPMGCEGPNAA